MTSETIRTITMPKLGLTMTEGLLASWRVKPGDQVRAGDVLFVVETEKIATDVEAPSNGKIVSLEVAEGSIVPVGATVATWIENVMPLDAVGSSRGSFSNTTRVIATPLARRLARQANIDLKAIRGSGPRGRIKARDVETAAAQQAVLRAEADVSPHAASAIPSSRKLRRPANLSEMTVARRLTEAKRNIPHFYVIADADVTRLLQLRDELNAAKEEIRLSLTHFVMAAVVKALTRFPDINRVWDANEIVTLDTIDIGLAVMTERGLVAPVLRNADRLSLDGIARACEELVTRARRGRLTEEDLAGGAISVSNVGMFGAAQLIPIINPGQAAILGVAAVRPVFRPDDRGQPSLRKELSLALSCDHRVLDGVSATRFLNAVAEILAQPLTLLRR